LADVSEVTPVFSAHPAIEPSGYIFDIETANLDNQWLVLQQSNAPPLDTMFADGMARYFAGGFAEIPLDETPTAPLR